MLEVGKICQMARYSIGDAGHITFSDYEMLTALQAALDVLVQSCSDVYSPLLAKKQRILLIRGVGHLPADYYSVLSVRELIKDKKHEHRDHHGHHHRHAGYPIGVFPEHHDDETIERPDVIPPELPEGVEMPPHDHHHERPDQMHDDGHHHHGDHFHRPHGEPPTMDWFYFGDELKSDYESALGPYTGYYRVDSDKIYTSDNVEYVEMTYIAAPKRLQQMEDFLDLPNKCELPLARMTKSILMDDFDKATEIAGKFALSYKNQSYSNPYKPELWGGYNPWA